MTSMSLLEKGRELYESGEFEQAIVYFDKASYDVKGLNTCEIFDKKGISLLYLGKYKEAKECADEAIGINGNDGLALTIKAEALNYLGDSSKAIEYADKAIDLSIKKNDYDVAYYAWFVKGYAIDYSGDHDQALMCFDKAIQYRRDNAVEALIAKGVALNYLKHYNEAEMSFDKAIEISKKNINFRYQDIAYAFLNKSVSLYNLERNKEVSDCLTEAESYSSKSISKNPHDAHAWMIKGVTYFKLGLYDMAIRCYDKIIMDMNPVFDLAWCLKGYALNYLERYEEALRYFDEAIKLNPEDPDYHMGKGISLFGLEKYNDAIKCFDKAVDQESTYADIVFFLKGASNYGNGWNIEALGDFKKVSDANLDDQKHINIGACYYSIGLVEQARNEYDIAMKSNPKLVEAYYNLGVLYSNEGKVDLGRKLFENCLELDKKFTKARDGLLKLDSPTPTSEWFKWWFSNGKGKKALGITLIISVFALIISAISTNTYIFYDNQNIASNTTNESFATEVLGINQSILSSEITGITIMIGLLIVILLLPSLRRVKVGDIELEPVTIDTKIHQHLEALISKLKFGMQSF